MKLQRALNSIYVLEVENVLVEDQEKIKSAFFEYYRELYQNNALEATNKDYELVSESKMSSEMNDELLKLPSLEKIKQVVNDLPKIAHQAQMDCQVPFIEVVGHN